jgi:hypothetical protein
MRRLVLTALLLGVPLLALAQRRTVFVFVQIMDQLPPKERDAKYEVPVDAALKKERVGEVTGAGTSMSREGRILWIGLDVELVDVDRGLPVLLTALRQAGAPTGSKVSYEQGGKKVELPVDQ